MSATSRPAAAHGFGTSRWAQLAAILLIALGITTLVSVLVPNNYGFGLIVIPFALVNIVIGTFVWLHHTWARLVGLVTCAFGIVVGLIFLPSALFPVAEPGSTWPMLRQELVLAIVPYIAAIVGLVLGGRHFRRE